MFRSIFFGLTLCFAAATTASALTMEPCSRRVDEAGEKFGGLIEKLRSFNIESEHTKFESIYEAIEYLETRSQVKFEFTDTVRDHFDGPSSNYEYKASGGTLYNLLEDIGANFGFYLGLGEEGILLGDFFEAATTFGDSRARIDISQLLMPRRPWTTPGIPSLGDPDVHDYESYRRGYGWGGSGGSPHYDDEICPSFECYFKRKFEHDRFDEDELIELLTYILEPSGGIDLHVDGSSLFVRASARVIMRVDEILQLLIQERSRCAKFVTNVLVFETEDYFALVEAQGADGFLDKSHVERIDHLVSTGKIRLLHRSDDSVIFGSMLVHRSTQKREYIRDYQVAIAEASREFDPVIDVIEEGFSLCIEPISASEGNVQMNLSFQMNELATIREERIASPQTEFGTTVHPLELPEMNELVIESSFNLPTGSAVILGRTNEEGKVIAVMINLYETNYWDVVEFRNMKIHFLDEILAEAPPRMVGSIEIAHDRSGYAALTRSFGFERYVSGGNVELIPLLDEAYNNVTEAFQGGEDPLGDQLFLREFQESSIVLASIWNFPDDRIAYAAASDALAQTVSFARPYPKRQAQVTYKLLDGERVVAAGSTVCLEKTLSNSMLRTSRAYIRDYDVQIASAAMASDPVIAHSRSGNQSPFIFRSIGNPEEDDDFELLIHPELIELLEMSTRRTPTGSIHSPRISVLSPQLSVVVSHEDKLSLLVGKNPTTGDNVMLELVFHVM
ncbi:MAG: hypothetical protein NUW37_02615 [Planctomycetes bacterium]|nr:hypothetical protein [Planctomycetota bacterium]